MTKGTYKSRPKMTDGSFESHNKIRTKDRKYYIFFVIPYLRYRKKIEIDQKI